MIALSSKLISQQNAFFTKMLFDTVMILERLLIKLISIKKVQGRALEESQLVVGMAFKKTLSYAVFEMQSKKYKSPKIALLYVELELKAEKDNVEISIHTVEDYQTIVDAKWNIIYYKLKKIFQSRANVILSKYPIEGVATLHFADRDMFCAVHVPGEDLKRMVIVCEGSI